MARALGSGIAALLLSMSGGCGNGGGSKPEIWHGVLSGQALGPFICLSGTDGWYTEQARTRFEVADLPGKILGTYQSSFAGTFDNMEIAHPPNGTGCAPPESVVSTNNPAVESTFTAFQRTIEIVGNDVLVPAHFRYASGFDAFDSSRVVLQPDSISDERVEGRWFAAGSTSAIVVEGRFSLVHEEQNLDDAGTSGDSGGPDAPSGLLFEDGFDNFPSASYTVPPNVERDFESGNPLPSVRFASGGGLQLTLTLNTPQPELAPTLALEVDAMIDLNGFPPDASASAELHLGGSFAVASLDVALTGGQMTGRIECLLDGTTTEVALAPAAVYRRLFLRFDGTNLRCGYDGTEVAVKPLANPAMHGAGKTVTLELVKLGNVTPQAHFDNLRIRRL